MSQTTPALKGIMRRSASHEERGQRCRNAAQASDDVLSLGSHDSKFDLDNRKDNRLRLTPSFHAALVIPKQRNDDDDDDDDDDSMMKGKREMKRLRALCANPSWKVPPSVRPGRLAVVSPPLIPLHFCLPGRDGILLHSSLDGLECYLRGLAHGFLLEGSSSEWAVVSTHHQESVLIWDLGRAIYSITLSEARYAQRDGSLEGILGEGRQRLIGC
ncbi:hypothetical protein AAL_02391 [Moelleriella libera RCEF 2490]|uniref:Uncharacterized protein n=1 Tax=Moelleriella libera RCEF 2490 TaxID=1081109 RepID=A0A166PT13_9HYPO|nr:hypothetical protein AAL_02391 [Moelleriella libera RCEF 2490]